MKKYFRSALLLLALGFMVLPFGLVSGSTEPKKPGAADPSAQQQIASKLAPATATFTVNSTGDTPDAVPGDGLCDDGTGQCTLRAALMEANALAGTDTINFNIVPAGPKTFSPGIQLPTIVDTVIINGTTQPGFSGTPIIELKGGPGAALLTVAASNSTIRGLVINGKDGGAITLQGNNNKVVGNFLGTDLTGTAAGPGNAGAGVDIQGSGNIVGGAAAADRNIIGFNDIGVNVRTGVSNLILANSIFNNFTLGINLSDDVVTSNDGCDGDSGPNNLQNYPSLTGAQSDGSLIAIQGSLNSVASTSYQVDFYANSVCHPSGFGEGQAFIGSTMVTTDASCNASFSATFAVSVPAGQVVTATATDSSSNTSEFSQCVTVGMGQFSDLQITSSDSPDPVLTGSNITYAFVVTNNGPDAEIGAIFNDTVPAGTTFVSLTSPGSCNTPSVGGTGMISCSFGALASGASITISLVVNVSAAPGSTIINTASISGMSSDPTLANNSATANTTVSGGCSLTCPASLTRNTDSNQCGAVVTYPPPETSGICGTVVCNPASGAFFPKGATIVTCSTGSVVGCSFGVTVVDNTPPRITCPADMIVPTDPGMGVAVVNYALSTFSDNCPDTTAVCVPPSGTVFPPGVSTVTCSAQDSAGNTAFCFFTVTVGDTEKPLITCPANLSAVLPSGQTSAVVNYPSPTISDNLPGATVVCLPVSGSRFPFGTTTVTCTAVDALGNRAGCSFIVTVGGPQAGVTIPGSKGSVEFATVPPARKPPKAKKTPCSPFTIRNIGFAPLVLTLDSISRTGANVDNKRITDSDDTRFFSLSRMNADESLSQLDIGATLTLQPGETLPFCVKFAALLPALAGKTTGLSASNVLPDTVTSKITFRLNADTNITIPLLAHVFTGVVLIDPVNPRTLPTVTFTRNGNDITVSYALFDSNLDVSRAKYEFLNTNGQVVAGPFEIDLAEPLRALNLVRGQSFGVEQRFTGASSSAEITAVRVTVFDGETTAVSDSSTASATPLSASSIRLMRNVRAVTLYPSDIKLGAQFQH